MTPDPVTLAALGGIDGTLLLISYLTYRKIKALSLQWDTPAGSP